MAPSNKPVPPKLSPRGQGTGAPQKEATFHSAPTVTEMPAVVDPAQLTGAQRRERARVKMQAAITMSSDNNFFNGFSTNISDGGVFIATVTQLPIGTEMDLSFSLPSGEQIKAHGVVRWTREVNDKTPDIMPGLGVQFTQIDEAALAAIQDFVRDREPMFFPD